MILTWNEINWVAPAFLNVPSLAASYLNAAFFWIGVLTPLALIFAGAAALQNVVVGGMSRRRATIAWVLLVLAATVMLYFFFGFV
jgi:hypothetical protein